MNNTIDIRSLKEKIDGLNHQAWELRVNDLPKSFELSQESVKLARDTNYPKGLAEALRSLGFCYIRLFKNDEADPLLKESLSLFESLNDLNGQAIVYEYLGIIQRNWGNLSASLELLLKSHTLILQSGDPEIEITSCYQIGVTYKHLGNHENALDYLYRSLSLAKETGFKLMEAYATNIIGSIYFDNGDYEKALDCYQQGLTIRQQSHDKWGEAGSLDNIGFTYLKLKETEKAIDYCKQSLDISQATGDKKGEANALLHLAEIYEQASDIKQASKFSNESLEIRKARGDRRGEVEVLLFLADLHGRSKDVEDHQIHEWLFDALNIADEIKAKDLLSKTHYYLHAYYMQKENFKESVLQLETHLQIEKELHKNAINQKIQSLEISRKAEAISQRNKELTELNEKIEKANAELKIEASLERVRTVAMSMMKPGDLINICQIQFKELLDLGFTTLRNVIIDIFNDDKSYFSDYEYSDETGGSVAKVRYGINTVVDNFHRQIKTKNDAFAEIIIDKSQLGDWKQFRKETGQKDDPRLENAEVLYYYFYSIGLGDIGISTFSPITAEQLSILKRFRNVFDLAYRRYTDITNAEAQAREAQVEAALERVRAKVMAMQTSGDLTETSLVFGEQLRKLAIEWQFSYFWLIDEAKNENVFWITWPDYKTSFTSYTLAEAEQYFNDCLIAWRAGVKIHDNFVPSAGVQEWLDTFQRVADDAGGAAKRIMVKGTFPDGVYYYDAMMKYGSFGICVAKPATDEEKNIQSRFAIEFERAYTRFLGLQKAEAQARESQIQLALERVRARTMAMQHSNELQDAAILLFDQIKTLGILTGSCAFNIWNVNEASATVWSSSVEGKLQAPFELPHTESPIYKEVYTSAKKADTILVKEVGGVELKKHFDYLTTVPGINHVINKLRESGYVFPEKIIYHFAFFNQGYLSFHLHEFEPGAKEIFVRFAKVFEQTYTRFLDLQKAEAQAREAQIEAALERVRARTMAMHKSDELGEAAVLLYKELKSLGVTSFLNCGYVELDEEKNIQHGWMTKTDGSLLEGYTIPLTGDPILQQRYEAWKRKEPVFCQKVAGEELKKHTEFTSPHLRSKEVDEMVKKEFPDPTIYYCGNFYHGYLHLITGTFLHGEEEAILARFTRVFEMTYKRFLDLQKAEAQAREAQIQLSLERVRAKAMAMHSSKELDSVIKTVYAELKQLDVAFALCFIMIFDERKGATWWMGSPDGDLFHDGFYVQYHTHPPHLAYLKGWQDRQQEWEYWLGGQIKKDWDEFIFNETELSKLPSIIIQNMKSFDHAHLAASFENFGCMTVGGDQRLSDESYNILSRFAKVFDLCYTRFLDLQKAEAQTREALIEGALERVRARALAMQEPEELKDVAQVLRNEMGALGIEELETSSIYIHGHSSENVECWYALQDPKQTEKKMVSDHFVLNLDDTWVGREMKKFYRSDEKQTSLVMSGANRKEWIQYCYEHSPVFSGFYGETIPDRTYHLYKFSHGCIGAAAPGDISAESWRLLSRAASVFSLAYSRFKDLTQARNDLVKLKEEKKRAEDALSELQATQKQLIQSEKMASLGELTAGIAHEIQNPLNFVNNFSDVSNELLEEMKEELATGNTQSAMDIAKDVKDNLEKILHHGKRADAIVKGMLQHSRSSSGQKEFTDINALAEEYLRLAYHGLRAKDKSFNANFKTEFDPTVGKINIIPQDIGRVILNLINNAFYAVNEKRQMNIEGYEPTVTVSTKKIANKSEIRVSDNGNGIPQKILDKIFQPFFTTKPTGQGTGLGLSLAYDIVTKGHGGELKVETKEGEGSEFLIQLTDNATD